MQISRRRFEQLAAEALDAIPRPMLDASENVAVIVEDRPGPDLVVAPGTQLLGLYQGNGTKPAGIMPRGWAPTPISLPDRITLFREPLAERAHDEDELREQIRATLVHEFAHHFGIDDARLDELGW